MEEQDLDPRICRICEEKKFLVDMQEEENYHLLKKLQEIEEIKKKTDVENFDEVFKYICRSCESALEGYFQFRNRVRKMRRKLMHAAVTGRIAIPAEPITEAEVEEIVEFIDEEPLLEDSIKVEQTDDPIFVAEPEFVVIDYLEEVDQVSGEPLEMINWDEETTEYPKIPQRDQETPLKIAKESKIVCSQCKPVKREFKDQKALADHISKDHPPRSKNCPSCGRAFTEISSFLQHLKLHSCSNYQCRFCERVYKSKINWEIHELGHRTGESEAQEHLKLLRETRAKALNLRIKAKKRGPRKFLMKTDEATEKPEEKDPRGTECKICGAWYRNMNLHMRVHRSKNFTCFFCYEKFKTKGLLRFHTKLNHNTFGGPQKKK